MVKKEIRIVELPKYSGSDYEHIAFGVYKNKKAGNYCLCMTASEGIRRRDELLDAIMDEYTLSCAEYCGEYVEINGEKIWTAELETDGDEIGDLMRILCVATADRREITAFPVECDPNGGEDVFLCVKLGGGVKVRTTREPSYDFPEIYGVRSDPYNGMMNFEPRYPEPAFVEQLKELLAKETFPGGKVYKAILINGFNAFLITLLRHRTVALMIEFNKKKVSRIVKGEEMIRLIRGSCQ